MSGIEFIEKLITDVLKHEARIWILFAWNLHDHGRRDYCADARG
jgi:hypothetical protein